jgi:hypothetical protein
MLDESFSVPEQVDGFWTVSTGGLHELLDNSLSFKSYGTCFLILSNTEEFDITHLIGFIMSPEENKTLKSW